MAYERSLSVPEWLSLPHETRLKLAEIFGLTKTGRREFVQMGLKGSLVSDGHTHADLRGITKEKMMIYTGLRDDDWGTLFACTVDKVEGKVPEAKTEVKEGKPCCGSKGPNHKKDCPTKQ